MNTQTSNSPFTITKEHADRLVDSLTHGGHLNFQNQANRNWVAKLARQRGIKVTKSSIRNQLLDPRYTVENSSDPDLGFANDYKHHFSVLYQLEREREYWRY